MIAKQSLWCPYGLLNVDVQHYYQNAVTSTYLSIPCLVWKSLYAEMFSACELVERHTHNMKVIIE